MLLEFFQWCEATGLGQTVRTSVWLFPILEAVHLLGLCLLGGTILVVDLRMLGLGLTRQRIGDVARDARPWLLVALAVMVVTGTPMFLSEALKCYYNTAFWVKVTTLPVALLFTLTIRAKTARTAGLAATVPTRVVAVMSLGLWFTVAAGGRWIGFSS